MFHLLNETGKVYTTDSVNHDEPDIEFKPAKYIEYEYSGEKGESYSNSNFYDSSLYNFDLAPSSITLKKGTKIKIVENGISSFMGLINPKSSAEYSLCDANKGEDFKSNDDVVFAQLCQAYPKLLKSITKEKDE